MSRRKTFFAVSLVLLGISAISLAVQGLDLGIDFKGGTKLIVAFAGDADVDRGRIKATIEQLVADKTGETGTQVEVQDFDVGAEVGKHRRRFVVYTELTSLLSPERRQQIVAHLRKTFGETLQVDVVKEGEDKFYLTFPDKASVNDRAEAIRQAFTALGYEHLTVKSDVEHRIEMEFYKTLNLAELDRQHSGESDEPSPFEKSVEEFEAEKKRQLETATDRFFTVRIEELKSEVTTRLTDTFGDAFLEVESSTAVSASVGRSMLAEGLLAILYALIGILLYIALRFDFRYSPGAVVALAHDSLITIGAFSLLQIKFTQPIIAAILTIIGYSLNDTIVVYDRIRENVARFRTRRLDEVINSSINQTLSRTVLTSLTTLLVVVSILVLGGGLIRDFAFALFVGIVVGTYSSIFVASPLVLYLDAYFARRARTARKAGARPATSSSKS